jgi:hypothetical protein
LTYKTIARLTAKVFAASTFVEGGDSAKSPTLPHKQITMQLYAYCAEGFRPKSSTSIQFKKNIIALKN